MLREVTVPGTLSRVLTTFRPCFTAPTFTVFSALVAGLVAQPVSRTVCGMLTGAGLARVWWHGRAHRFFSAAKWCPQQVGLVLAELIVTQLLAPGAPITVAVDDTLFRRRGKKVHGVGWFHDGSAAGQTKLGFGNNWVVVAIIVTLPFMSRPVALPVLAALAVKGGDQSKPDLARDLVDLLAERFLDREVHIVGDAAYGCGAFIGLGDGMTMTTRAKTNSVFHHPTPERTGKRGRPRLKGDRIGTATDIATTATWRNATVSRYGVTSLVRIAEVTCLWFGTWRTDPRPRHPPARHHHTHRLRDHADHHRPDRHPRGDHRPLRRPLRNRGHLLRGQEHPRGRPSPQPGPQGRRTHRPLRPVLLQHPHHLVRATRPRPHRRGPASRGRALVHDQNRTLHPGHAHQTPPPDHHRPISPILPPTSHNPRNPGSPARLGPRRRLKCKSRARNVVTSMTQLLARPRARGIRLDTVCLDGHGVRPGLSGWQ